MMPRSLRRAVAAVAVLGATPGVATSHLTTANAQDVSGGVVLIRGSVQEFAEPFSHVGELAELPDGRVLVSDFRENRLLLVDFTKRTVRDAARAGGGPREFRGASPMLAAPRGEVWIWDIAQDRILLIDATGAPRGTRPANLHRGVFAVLPRAADASGRVYGEFRGWKTGLVQQESTAVVRITGTRKDSLALIQPLLPPHRTARDRHVIRASGFTPQDAWGVFPDGRVLIVRSARYQPELILPDGVRRLAAPIPYAALPVTVADKRAHMAAAQQVVADARRLSQSAENGQAMAAVRVAEPLEWASVKPPIRDGVIRIDAKSRAWVAVHDAHEATGPRYDLLDREGRRVGAVRLPPGERLAGFGSGVLYTVRQDEDDLSWLRRYPLP